jgi:membrane protein implicated in regulation of membrane protease activity
MIKTMDNLPDSYVNALIAVGVILSVLPALNWPGLLTVVTGLAGLAAVLIPDAEARRRRLQSRIEKAFEDDQQLALENRRLRGENEEFRARLVRYEAGDN